MIFGLFGPKAPDISLLLFYGTAYQRFLAATLATDSVARPSSSLTLPRVRPSTLLRLMNRRAGASQGERDQRSNQGIAGRGIGCVPNCVPGQFWPVIICHITPIATNVCSARMSR